MKITLEYSLKFNTRLNSILPYDGNTPGVYFNTVICLFEELLREITLSKEV
jgi:hypothetical protein